MAYGEPRKSLRYGANKSSFARGRPRRRNFIARRRVIVPYGREVPVRGAT